MTPLPDNPSPQLRWFIALIPPQEIQDRAEAVIEDLTAQHQTRTAKAPPHITLMPPFELAANAIAPVKRALSNFAQQQVPFGVTLDGFSAFPPRVLFIDVVRSSQLLQLKAELETCLVQQCDLPHDNHLQFSPHMTVASRKLDRVKFKTMWAELEPRPFDATWESNALTLLRYEQQRWHIDQVFKLGLPTCGLPT